jgi:CheY-like chemotaxis protein
MNRDTWLRAAIAVVAVALAILRLLFITVATENVDSTLVLLFVIAVLVLTVPWERLKHFRAGSIEVELEQPQLQGALSGMASANQEELQKDLLHLAPKIELAKGGRVLWLDDRPHVVVAERRFLRALGIEIIPATPMNVEGKIREDNDFDLIISDIQWINERGEVTYGGMEFVKELRTYPDPVISSVPVVFYTAYTPEAVSTIIQEVELPRFPKAEYAYSIRDLVTQVITLIAESRSYPIKVGKKQPT